MATERNNQPLPDESSIADLIRSAAAESPRTEPAPAVKSATPGTWEKAVDSLPSAEDPLRALEWVRDHPAMVRKNRAKNKGEDVLLTARDLLNAPHGKCPSKYAASLLQHYVNRPDEFFKLAISTDLKRKDAGENQGRYVENDASLREVTRLLGDLLLAERGEDVGSV